MRLLVVISCLLLTMPFASAPAQEAQSARELVVEAVALMRRAQATEDVAQRVALLEEAQERLERVIIDYPESDAAARLRSGEGIVVLGEPNLTLARIAALLDITESHHCLREPTWACIRAALLASGRAIEDAYSRAWALGEVAKAQAAAGGRAAAKETLAAAVEAARGVEEVFFRTWAHAVVAGAQAVSGEIAPALATVRGIEEASSRAWALAVIAGAQAAARDKPAAKETLAAAIEIVQGIEEAVTQAESRRGSGH